MSYLPGGVFCRVPCVLGGQARGGWASRARRSACSQARRRPSVGAWGARFPVTGTVIPRRSRSPAAWDGVGHAQGADVLNSGQYIFVFRLPGSSREITQQQRNPSYSLECIRETSIPNMQRPAEAALSSSFVSSFLCGAGSPCPGAPPGRLVRPLWALETVCLAAASPPCPGPASDL